MADMNTNLQVQITPETAELLNTPVAGCRHDRPQLTLVDKAKIFCVGCGSWFPVSGVVGK